MINPTAQFRDQVFGGNLIASIASFFGIKIFEEKYLVPSHLGAGFGAWADRGGAEPIYMKAAGLGHYFFMDRQSRYWDLGFLLTRKDGLYNSLIWRLVDVGDGNYKMYSPAMDVWLFQHITSDMGATKLPNFSPTVRFEPAEGCTPYPEPPTDAQGAPRNTPWPDRSVFGMADSHLHLFSADSLGQQVMAGKTYSPLGVKRALGDSSTTHGTGAYRDAIWLVDEQSKNDPSGYGYKFDGCRMNIDGDALWRRLGQ